MVGEVGSAEGLRGGGREPDEDKEDGEEEETEGGEEGREGGEGEGEEGEEGTVGGEDGRVFFGEGVRQREGGGSWRFRVGVARRQVGE